MPNNMVINIMKEMEILIKILNKFGIQITNQNESIVIYSICVFFLSLLILLTFLNILIYFSILISLEKDFIKSKLNKLIQLKYGWIIEKIINLYKNTRIIFIVIEISIFIWLISILIWSSYTIFTNL